MLLLLLLLSAEKIPALVFALVRIDAQSSGVSHIATEIQECDFSPHSLLPNMGTVFLFPFLSLMGSTPKDQRERASSSWAKVSIQTVVWGVLQRTVAVDNPNPPTGRP